LHAASDAETGLALHAERLKREGILRSANQGIAAHTDNNGGAGADTRIISGEVTGTELNGRREHRPGQRGLGGDAEVDANLGDARGVEIVRTALRAEYAADW
jgi:hypothetical protein